MKQSPSEAKSHSATQEILCVLLNSYFHYRVHKVPPSAPILRQTNLVHTLLPYFPNIHFTIIFPLTHRSCRWCLPYGFSNENIVFISYFSHPRFFPFPPHPPWSGHPNIIWWSVVAKLLIMQSSPASRHFLPLRSKCSPQNPVLILGAEGNLYSHQPDRHVVE
jgi:hypothetical protein